MLTATSSPGSLHPVCSACSLWKRPHQLVCPKMRAQCAVGPRRLVCESSQKGRVAAIREHQWQLTERPRKRTGACALAQLVANLGCDRRVCRMISGCPNLTTCIQRHGQNKDDEAHRYRGTDCLSHAHAEHPGSVTPRQRYPECNRDASAGFTASSLLYKFTSESSNRTALPSDEHIASGVSSLLLDLDAAACEVYRLDQSQQP